MRQIKTLAIILLLPALLFAAGETIIKNGLIVNGPIVAGSTTATSTKAILELNSTTKGLLFPRQTTVEKDAITSPPAGLMIYDTTLDGLAIRNDSAWLINTSDITLGAFGSSDNSSGASLSAQALTLQPASATNPGGVSTTTQSFAGNKTFTGSVRSDTSLILKEQGSTDIITIQGASGSSSYTLTLPVNDGSASQVLTTDGSGNLSWSTSGGAGSYEFVGMAYIAATSGCVWGRTNTAIGAFTGTAACPGPTIVTNPGSGTIQTTDADLPRFTVNDLPAGTYKVTIGFFGYGTSTSALLGYAINGGADTSPNSGGNPPAADKGFYVSIIGFYTFASTDDRTFEVYGKATTGTVRIEAADGSSDVTFSIEKVSD